MVKRFMLAARILWGGRPWRRGLVRSMFKAWGIAGKEKGQ